ncbi:long-chain fatty acid--CoA ligase [Alicyclobacillus tolerans]|uniref:long-chain fatty acid--CoA ligase n=1 Tax=Alicyclobacillus tolerans TaxID=90970 RepID=UPI001F23C3FC|nr:long-chain fatty acid--CoA ligase [Alicyclobacillus tolerans]MCF8565243.1 long-chain fatty acid--CoA ligase [Alicyclobacillus tolerans]
MMQTPLLMKSLLERAEKLFPNKEVVSRTANGLLRYTYREYGQRTRRLSSVLASLGVERGDRVATFAWNSHRHLEAYFAIPSMGAVLHTVNIRLFPEQIAYIVNHAEDKVMLIDEDLVPLIEGIQDKLPTVLAYIIMSDKAELPATTLQPAYSYEALLQTGDPSFEYPDDLDENAPMGMCYTSATTGNPKGVVYSHRGIVLHSYAVGLVDTIGMSESDTVLPIVPMFHANAWGQPFAAVWYGSKQVLPGPQPNPHILLDLMEQEQVTLAAAVPTIWLSVAKLLDEHPRDLKLRAVLCGGSAAPRALIQTYEEKYNIPFVHAYGMTETSPLATFARLKSYQRNLSKDEILDYRAKQGFLVPGLDMRVVGDRGDVAWNGEEMGELLLRGPWIASEYYRDERTRDAFKNGWLHTGDVATIDPEGFIKLVDRTKDLVKSGGEWISSMDLENALMAHPAVFEATVVGIPHPKWYERPLAFVTLKDAFKSKVDKQELIEFLRPHFAKWWLPDDVVFIDEIPKTSVGKFLKRALRDQYASHFKPN